MGRYQSGQLGLTVTQLAYAFVGSNPALPTTKFQIPSSKFKNSIWNLKLEVCNLNAGVAQSIEH
jgi:hypothetical protein